MSSWVRAPESRSIPLSTVYRCAIRFCFLRIHEILTLLDAIEFDFRVVGDGRSATARYANNSNYRNDSLIRKESRLTHQNFFAPKCYD